MILVESGDLDTSDVADRPCSGKYSDMTCTCTFTCTHVHAHTYMLKNLAKIQH